MRTAPPSGLPVHTDLGRSDGTVHLLLTSGGVTSPAIHDALVGLLGRPVAECSALFVPTAQHGHSSCSPTSLWRSVAGPGLCDLGWRSVGILELTALPSTDPGRWEPWVREADVLLVDGGDATYLAHWMRGSGLLDLLPSLTDTVWVGISAGSMVMTPRIGADFVSWQGGGGDDRTLGLVDFSIFPHVGHPQMPDNTMAAAEEWAAGIGGPSYALDERSAIVVSDGRVEVVSDGEWRHFPSSPAGSPPA